MALDDKELICEEPNLVKLLTKQSEVIKMSSERIEELREKKFNGVARTFHVIEVGK